MSSRHDPDQSQVLPPHSEPPPQYHQQNQQPQQNPVFYPQGQPLQQYPRGQPGMVAMPQNPAFYTQGQPGIPQNYPHGQPQVVILPSGASSVYHKPPDYKYVPNDFMSLSLLTVIVCGLFSPASLVFSIPAILFSRKSKNSYKLGSVNNARSQGIAAAYLNVSAIFFALVVLCIATGLVVGLYGPSYGLNSCIARVEAQYGGSLPPVSTDRYSSRWPC